MNKIKRVFLNFKKIVFDFFSDRKKRNVLILSASFLTTLSICVLMATLCAINYPDYIYIENEDDLEKIRENLNGDFIFAKQNINIEKEWIPIGTKEQPFTGTILGNDCTISFSTENFNFMENDNYNYFGFFGNNSGTIKNLQFYIHEMNLESPNNKETVFGCVSAFNSGSISHCTIIQASGTINITSSGQMNVGAFCGIGSHNFVRLKSSANFILSSDDKIIAGGIVGSLNSKTNMWESQTTGRTTIKESTRLISGGMFGVANEDSSFVISNCSSRNTFVAFGESIGQFGGVGGKNLSYNSEIKNVYSNCNITNYPNTKNSNFICDGNITVENSVSNPNFANCSHEFVYGSFTFQLFDNVSFKNCFFTKTTVGSFDGYGEYSSLDALTLEKLKWDSKIWRKNVDGSFSLI